MRSKSYLGLAFALFLFSSAYSIFGQSAPSGRTRKIPIAIGAGFSGYNPDYGHGHILGGTLWIDYYPNKLPSYLRGFGVELEARDLNYGRSPDLPGNLREDTAQGGLIYAWPRYRNFRPYGKFSEGYGNADAESDAGLRYHNSRTIFSGGGGFEYRLVRSVWLRADYEYGVWPDFFKHPATPTTPALPAGRLNPQGFTLGAVYHFDRSRSR